MNSPGIQATLTSPSPKPKREPTPLEKRVKSFTAKLKQEYNREISEDLRGFKSRVIGTLKAHLPRQRPGRKASPQVRDAWGIYQRDYLSKDQTGNWHLIALQVFPEYANLTPDLQRLRRMSIRAAVHSLRHEEKARLRRTQRACC